MRRIAVIAFVVATLGVTLPSAAPTAAQPSAPAGATAMALDGAVQLAWQANTDASSYNVYRGTTAANVSTLVASGVTATTYTDSTAANGSTYLYAVRSVAAGAESANSLLVQATPRARACSSGNQIVVENCYPGNNPWNVRNTATIAAGGIEGYATALSINRGESVDLKVNSAATSTFRVEIYRTGYYGGAGARLFSTITGVPGTAQPACARETTTGLIDCSNWSTSLRLTTTSSWPTGIYAIRLVREDTGTDNQILLVVRDDSRKAQVVYGVGMSTFEAYNNYGGKSLYDFNSLGSTTVAGTPRAVKVSFDRPFEQPRSGLRDWYTRTEVATVTWLEQSGYDVSYISNTDLESNPSLVRGIEAYISPAHDEYVSAGMRNAMTAARDAGNGLFFSGGNEVYWKIRFESGPNGGSNRIEVCYKSTQSGGPDPSGIPTGTWRDPNGANLPENALSGQQYIGDNDNVYFPLVVSAVEGADRVYRYTPAASQAAGASLRIGSSLVGWEWDARVSNGQEPAGVKTLASSPVTGELLADSGATYNPSGSATVNVTKYTAASGALVFNTGTNHWNRGLARNAAGAGEPNLIIQQVTTNVLADMGATPTTPQSGIVLDGSTTDRPAAPTGVTATALGADSISITWNAVAGASGYSVYRTLAPRDNGQPLGQLASSGNVTGTTFTDIGLNASTPYYYVVLTTANGVQSLPSAEASATTAAGAGQPTRIDSGSTTSYTSAAGQTFLADTYFSSGNVRRVTTPIAGTNDPALYQSERWGLFNYAIPVANGTYDVRFHFAETYFGVVTSGSCVGKRVFGMDIVDTPANPDLANIDICAAVGPATAYVQTVSNVNVGDGVLNIRSVDGIDDPELTAIEVVPTALAPPAVTSTAPAAGAVGVPATTFPRATFSRAMDATTISGSTVTLAGPSGNVPSAVSYDSTARTVTITPNADLAFSTTYKVTLAASIKASDGASLGTAYTWQFTTASAPAPDVSSTTPADGDTGVGANVVVRATFTRPLDPSTVNGSSFTLRTAAGASVAATVTYDATANQASLKPSSPLAFGTTYRATLAETIATPDGATLGSAFTWSFSTATSAPAAPTLASYTPSGSAPVSGSTAPTATFSRAMDASTINTSTFTLRSASGPVAGTVTYDAASLTARFTPSAPLAPATSYTVSLSTAITAGDGTPFGGATFSFATAAGPKIVSTSPASGATSVSQSTAVTATFSTQMNASSITTATFALYAANGSVVPASVTYDPLTFAATLKPSSSLAGNATYTASVRGSVLGADGTPLGSDTTWKFVTSACPCSLFAGPVVPSQQNLSTRDGRSGTGPWTYELGVKFTVDQQMTLTAIRFWKSSSETGTHLARLWTTSGAQLASTTAAGETASGWQTATFTTPPTLQPGVVYIASVNANAYYSSTPNGLATAVVSGPIRTVADGRNGVFGSSAGTFPNQSYNNTNYFTDVVVVPAGTPTPPTVTRMSPAASATNVDAGTPVTATFSRSMDPATITASAFSLQLDGSGDTVDAAVTYDDTTNTATLTPSAPLTHGSTYDVTIDGSVRARDGTALGADVTWSFTVGAAPPPLEVTTVSPAAGATNVNLDRPVKITFNRAIDSSTLSSSTTSISGPGGAIVPATIGYDATSFTETIQPSTKLAASTTYVVTVTTGVRATDGTSMLRSFTSSFSTGACPCSLMTGLTPASVGNTVQDGRTGTGPWSYELGTKFTVDSAATLASIRFWKDARETGSHTVRLWSATGTLLASTPVTSETTGGGWQQADLATPFQLQANTTYVVSVNANAYFSVTRSGLATALNAGIAHSVADGRNGVYGSTAGIFPTSSYSSTNYFVDVVVR